MKHHKTDRGMDGPSTKRCKIMDSPFKSPRCILYQKAFLIYEENAIDWYKNEPYERWFLNEINEYTG